MAQQAAPAEAEADVPTVETWSDKDQRIVVTQPAAGVLYDLILRAKIDGTPEEVYDVLRDPNSHEIFRGIKATLSRTTLEDDGAGRRKLLVVHRALTRFLWLSVTFDTQLYVWEDDVARSIRFTNARSDGFMRQFEGTWHVQPFTQSTLDAIFRQCGQQQGQAQGTLGHAHAQQQQQQQAAVQQQQQRHGWLSPAGALSALSQRLHAGHAASSGASSDSATALVTLEQALAPRARPPGPVAHLVRGLCARVLHNMMADLRTEVARRQALATGLLEGAGDDTNEQQQHSSSSSKAVQQRRPPSLPVASLTCSSGSSGTGQAARSSSSSSSSGGLQQQLADLLAAAVPLAITVQL